MPIAAATPDNGRNLLVVGRKDVGLLQRKLGLIEKIDAFGKPLKGWNHRVSSLSRIEQRVR
jgi:hypothetical protein